MDDFSKGQRIKTMSGEWLEIVEKLGEGGQGIVYKVNYGGKSLALKWYFRNKLKDVNTFYRNIESNIKKGSPDPSFLWPQEITEYLNDSFGYLMELRPSEYKDFSEFLLARQKFSGVDAVLNAALSITKAFRKLHQNGYSYQDLNDGNFFVNPNTGDVLICDNDNVAPYGENLGIAGKCRYMAPEVVIGEKRPDVHTDRFSLSIILYLLLFLNHPLEGKRTMCPCLTEELERKFFGIEPIFAWDSQDDSNRPVRGVHTNQIKLWPVYPRFIREKFEEAFSKEVMIGQDKEHRIQEKEWQELFTQLRNVTVRCECGEKTFIDLEESEYSCINCGRKIKRFPILKVKRYQVVMAPENKVYACHVLHDSDDFMDERGEIIMSRMDSSVIGLKNNSDQVWNVLLPNGINKSYAQGQVIRIERGIKIDFGYGNIGDII